MALEGLASRLTLPRAVDLTAMSDGKEALQCFCCRGEWSPDESMCVENFVYRLCLVSTLWLSFEACTNISGIIVQVYKILGAIRHS